MKSKKTFVETYKGIKIIKEDYSYFSEGKVVNGINYLVESEFERKYKKTFIWIPLFGWVMLLLNEIFSSEVPKYEKFKDLKTTYKYIDWVNKDDTRN